MISIDLKSYFQTITYNWRQDREQLSHICKLTKTRVDPSRQEFSLDYGMEQTFLVKAIAQSLNSKKFFEIGTGRGTASYAVSLIEEIEEIYTVDILPFDYKRDEAINYKPAKVSNKDIYNLISFPQKNKINFLSTKDYASLLENRPHSFDLAFIDGCHEDPRIIMQDFNICLNLLKPNSWILWDDYDPQKFEVHKVVDALISQYGVECSLIEFRGHLFGEKSPEKNAGVILMKLNENLYKSHE